ncbi:MAG: HAD superfamily hydrolase (TIGR01549 family) [Enterobacterales bacterium]|jgi:HAD superfamily hydrolase (TIGR01549 family)
MTSPKAFNKIINIKALSFDLDDTLYNNKPVISKAYQLLFSFLEDNYPKVTDFFTFDSFVKLAITINQNHPQLVDLNVLRRLHIKSTLTTAGYNSNPSIEDEAFEVFWLARQDIQMFPEVKMVLSALAKRFPLVAITNGNACIKTMGLEQFFKFSVSPLDTGEAKPHPSMYLYATEKLAIQPQELLHIGDKVDIDIVGAQNAGCRSIWFNPKQEHDINNGSDAVIKCLSELLDEGFF